VDVKPEVQAAIRDAGVQHGMVLVNCLHTTCSIVITDSDIEDFVGLMARLIEDEGAYRHNDLRWSDCERGNAAAHLRASLLGHGVAIGIADGTLALDDEQAILLAEWDGPRSRTINIHILGA
jgi:secondary thiamine-phosphate synthase enzyme